MELESQIVYGPIWTRRFGWDIGVNLLPLTHKLCTFDCIYCQYGFNPPLQNQGSRFPSVAEVIAELSALWESCAVRTSEILHVTIAGNGEPMMHPRFSEVVNKIVEWRNRTAPSLRLALLSNGYRIHQPQIRKTLTLFDEPIIKLDCALPEKIRSMNRPLVPFDLEQFIDDLKKCDRIIIQTMFLKGWNDRPEDLRRWIEALRQIQPCEVQIYTICRTTPSRVLPLSNPELQSIANVTSTLLGIPVHAYFSDEPAHISPAVKACS